MFRIYFKERVGYFVIALVFSIIFALSFCLYHLPIKAVMYPTSICALCGAVVLFIDYRHKLEKYTAISNLIDRKESLPEQLPEMSTAEGEGCRILIENLVSEARLRDEKYESRYSEMIEYYTVWAHQIKTPIASMRLQLQNEDTELSRSLSGELNRIDQYADMVLTFLRLDSESTDYVIREYLIDDIIKQSVRKFSSEFIARKLRLDYEMSGLSVVTDEKWLGFVIEQLISNALKYTKKGGITIRAEQREDGVVMSVSDTGIGISPEDMPRVFEKGYTGLNGRRDKKASGIGLYLCRRICMKLSISISVESQPDKGTKFSLSFPSKVSV